MKWKDLIMLGGIEGNFSPSSGTYSDISYWTLDSGSSYDIDWYDKPILRGHHHVQDGEELWKCDGCGKVFRVKDTLECFGCGHPITEKSRFVLE